MQSDQQYFPLKPGLPLADQVGSGCMNNAHISSFFGLTNLSPGVKPLPPFPNVDFRPSTVCPRNFIIFDRTDNRSQIMYHPAVAPKFGHPGLNVSAPYFEDDVKRNGVNDEIETLSSLKEDSDDIDALLSLEEEEEYGEEEVSTARTDGNYESDSTDSCSSKPRKGRLPSSSFSQKSSSGSGSRSSGERKRQKMRKMVKVLRGIVPGTGSNRLNTVAVLDEAVRYLKSLKVEVQKFGVGNLKN